MFYIFRRCCSWASGCASLAGCQVPEQKGLAEVAQLGRAHEAHTKSATWERRKWPGRLPEEEMHQWVASPLRQEVRPWRKVWVTHMYSLMCLHAEGRGRWFDLEGSKQMGPGKVVVIFLNSYPVMQLKLAQLPSTVLAHWQLTKLFQPSCP